jgi:hypothetical protein
MRAASARNADVSFWPLFPDGGVACADERKLIACLALSSGRIDSIEQHARSVPAISLMDGLTVRGNTVGWRSARNWSKFQ